MGNNRVLTDQGTLEFKELASNGTAGVTIQSTADLTGGSGAYTLTLPVNDGGANEFLQTDGSGVLSWGSSTATLQSSYDNGAKITTAGAVPVEIEVGAASGNVALLLDQDDDFTALDITKDGTGAGDAIAILNSGTGKGISINQDGVANALDIDQAAVAADAVTILNAGTGRGIFINQDGAAVGLEIDQDGAAVALSLNQASANFGIEVIQAGAAAAIKVTAGAGPGLNIEQANDARVLSLTKTGAGAGEVIFIENDGTGDAISLQLDGVGRGIDITNNSSANSIRISSLDTAPGLVIDHTGTGGRCIDITNAATNTENTCVRVTGEGNVSNLIYFLKTGTAGGDVLQLENDGTGACLNINQDGNGIAFLIDSEATSNPLIDLSPVTGNTRGDIAFGAVRAADPTTPSEGDVWYNDTTKRFVGRTGLTADDSHTMCSGMGPSYGEDVTATISVGAISAAFGRVVVAAETGTADDLDTINILGGTIEGDTMIIQADAGDTITVKHNTGNIHLDASADKALVNGNQLSLVYDGTDWLQLTPMMVLP